MSLPQQIHNAGKWFVEHEPVLLFQLMGIATTYAANLGLHLDTTQLVGVVTALFLGSGFASRAAVFSPANHSQVVGEVAAVTQQATENKVLADIASLAPLVPVRSGNYTVSFPSAPPPPPSFPSVQPTTTKPPADLPRKLSPEDRPNHEGKPKV